MNSNIDEIEKQIAELQKKKAEILDIKRQSTLEEIKATIQRFGFTSSDLGFGKKQKRLVVINSRLEAKYINPEDRSQTWHGGRGAKPKWVKAYLEQGKNLADIEIKK